MISKKLEDAINYQINRELFSEYYYLSMASYFNSVGLRGFENFFLVQVEEEDSMETILNKLKLINGEGHGLLMLDNELAQRSFTPSAA